MLFVKSLCPVVVGGQSSGGRGVGIVGKAVVLVGASSSKKDACGSNGVIVVVSRVSPLEER